MFHVTYGYYAQGVDVSTAILPAGWQTRVVEYRPDEADGAVAICLDPYDLVVSKLVAHRHKDYTFASALIHAGLIDPSQLLTRAQGLQTPAVRDAVASWIASWITKYG